MQHAIAPDLDLENNARNVASDAWFDFSLI